MLQVDQLGQKLYKDFASYGSTHDTAASEMSRLNMLKLLEKLLQYERVLDVHMRLESQGVDLQKGDNTNIFNDEIDNGVLLATSAAEQAKLLKVCLVFTELSRVLALMALLSGALFYAYNGLVARCCWTQ